MACDLETETGRSSRTSPLLACQSKPEASGTRVKNRETLVSAFVAVPEKLGFCFQVKDRSSQSAAFDERELGEFCDYLGGAH